jgi:hypothetical protein
MPDMLWEDVEASFKIDGSMKLVYVEAAGSMTIWQALADWVSARGPDHRYTETGTAGPALHLPAVEDIFERRRGLANPHLQCLSGWIAMGIRAWLFFSQFTSVWFAVSQSDIQSQAELEIFIDAIATLGRHLGYGLSVVHEHDIRRAGPILRYDPVTDAVSQP